MNGLFPAAEAHTPARLHGRIVLQTVVEQDEQNISRLKMKDNLYKFIESSR